ncbi:glycosyltransferase family 39 protein [Streptomyces sp. NPDC004838]
MQRLQRTTATTSAQTPAHRSADSADRTESADIAHDADDGSSPTGGLKGAARGLKDAARRAWPALAGYALVRLVGLTFIMLRSDQPLLTRLSTRHDSFWFLKIAESGYTETCPSIQGEMCRYAFFPLYPELIRGVSAVFPVSPSMAGWIIALVSSLVAAWGIYAVVEVIAGRRTAIVTAVLWGIVPHAVVQSMTYTESLFTALAAWALYAVLTKRWLTATALAVFAGLTRPPGAAVVAAVVLCALWALLRPGPDGERPVGRLLTAVLVSPLGWFAWFGWVGYRAGRWDGYFQVQDRWGSSFDGGVFTAQRISEVFSEQSGRLSYLVIAGTILAAATLLVICVLQRQPAPLLIYGAIIVLMTIGGEGYFHSKGRFLVPAFVLLIPLAKVLARSRTAVIWTLLTAATLVSSLYGSYVLLVASHSP